MLLRLGAAAELLQGHHSAQRAARQPPPSSMPREQQQRLSRSQRRKLQAERAGDPGEQRRPHWGCSECGEPRNWACRSSCRGCGASGPQHLEAGRRAEACGGGPGGGRTAGPGGAGRPSTSRAQWRLRPGEVSASSPKAAPMAAQGFRPGERTARTPKARSTPPRGQAPTESGAAPKQRPAVKSFASVVGMWRPEVLAASQDPEDSDVDEDLEAVAAVELLTVEEQQRLRLRYLRKRPSGLGRSAGRTSFPATRRSGASWTRPGSRGRGLYELRLRRMRSKRLRQSGTA